MIAANPSRAGLDRRWVDPANHLRKRNGIEQIVLLPPHILSLVQELDVIALGSFFLQPISQDQLPQGKLLEGRSGKLHFHGQLFLLEEILSIAGIGARIRTCIETRVGPALEDVIDELPHGVDDLGRDSFHQRLDVALSGSDLSSNIHDVFGGSGVAWKSHHGIVAVFVGGLGPCLLRL